MEVNFSFAPDLANHWLDELPNLGKGYLADTEKSGLIKFEPFWEFYRNNCRSHISEDWKRAQDQLVRDHIVPTVGAVPMSKIQPVHIRQILNLMNSKELSAQTTRIAFNIVHSIFERAIDEFGLNLRNPALRKLKPKVARKARNYLKPEESRMLMLKSRNHYLGPAIWLGLAIGLRSEAIIALRVGRIDFVNGEISIRAGYKKTMNRIAAYPKGKDWSVVGMPDDLQNYLRSVTAGQSSDDFVCTGPTGEMLRYEHFNRALAKICAKEGIPRVTTHELRHSASELYYEMGATDEDVRQLLGHKDVSTTLIYKHRSPDRLRRISKDISLTPKLEIVG